MRSDAAFYRIIVKLRRILLLKGCFHKSRRKEAKLWLRTIGASKGTVREGEREGEGEREREREKERERERDRQRERERERERERVREKMYEKSWVTKKYVTIKKVGSESLSRLLKDFLFFHKLKGRFTLNKNRDTNKKVGSILIKTGIQMKKSVQY